MSSMGDIHLVIQSDRDNISTVVEGEWVSRVTSELTQLPHTRSTESERWVNQSIYKIPCSMKELCSGAYQPQTVSIGPYHHGEPRLEVMEEHKHRALLTFLERSKKPLEDYVTALEPMVEHLRGAYHQLESKWKEDKGAFLQLMIVDGIFLLEIMRITTVKSPKDLSGMGYASNDPVFSNHGKLSFVPYLRRDILKLENQLPLSLLIKLLLVEDGSYPVNASTFKEDELITLILKFLFQRDYVGNAQIFRACLHILDLHRKSLILRTKFPAETPPTTYHCLPCCGLNKEDDDFILSATKLSESGIDIKPSKTTNLNDISFHAGLLKLPLITVDDTTESNYLNMMAFERFQLNAGDEVRSYVYFMSSIINSARDARMLQSCGVVLNALGSDKAVANLFISLARDVSVDPKSALELVQKQMLDYCRRPLPHWMAYAKHNYFTNPWVGLSVLAAVFLFALAGIQTVYTVIGYYNPKKG